MTEPNQPGMVPNEELPGLWERADFEGGETDTVPSNPEPDASQVMAADWTTEGVLSRIQQFLDLTEIRPELRITAIHSITHVYEDLKGSEAAKQPSQARLEVTDSGEIKMYNCTGTQVYPYGKDKDNG